MSKFHTDDAYVLGGKERSLDPRDLFIPI